MKRILVALTCVAFAALVGTGVALAASHAKHRVAAVPAVASVSVHHLAQASDGGSCPFSASGHCGGSCPYRSSVSASAASSTPAVTAATSNVCPVSDPSKCPASCQHRSASTAVAAVASR